MARKYLEQKAKPANDAYTGMLAVSFLALLIGCGLLYLDYSQYPSQGPAAMDRNVKDRPGVDKDETKKSEEKKGPDEGDEKKDAEKDKG